MRSRGVALLLALLLAVAATAGVYLYIQGVRDDAKSEAVTVRVIVSTQNIPAGSQLDPLISAGIFTTKLFPSDTLVESPVTSVEQLRGETTSQTILANEQISTQRLSGTTELGGGILNIPPGFVAVTMQLEAPPNVAGFIRKGDHVQVFVTLEEKLVTLFPDVLILSNTGSISTTTGASSGGDRGGLVTVALEPGDAQKLVLAQQKGSVWLALIPPGEDGQPFRPIEVKGLDQ
jgi:pilus assembly protein CpaB